MIVDCIWIRHSITHSTSNSDASCIHICERTNEFEYDWESSNDWDADSLDRFIQQKSEEPIMDELSSSDTSYDE